MVGQYATVEEVVAMSSNFMHEKSLLECKPDTQNRVKETEDQQKVRHTALSIVENVCVTQTEWLKETFCSESSSQHCKALLHPETAKPQQLALEFMSTISYHLVKAVTQPGIQSRRQRFCPYRCICRLTEKRHPPPSLSPRPFPIPTSVEGGHDCIC